MKTILTIAFFIVVQQSNAQIKYDYNWVLGYDNDLGMEGGDGILLNFDSGEVLISSFQKDMFMHTDNISMSNLNGVLLFYSNGCFIANKNHEIMLNGDNINPGTLHDSYCDHGYPMQQGMLGIPAPQQENKYYLFHTRYGNTPFYADKLYYSVIDIDLDGGLGGVIEKNIPIIEDTIWAGYLTAVKHSNNLDWWIISAKGFTNEFYKILLKSDGVHINDLQQIGLPLDYAAAGGQSVFSPDGTKYAWYDQVRNVQLFDFNRNTGALSNPQQLILADTNYLGGVAISPDSRFLYVSSAIYLYQFDLNSADIQSSKIVIDTFDGYSSPFPANFFLMQLGPDCRIYMSTGNQ